MPEEGQSALKVWKLFIFILLILLAGGVSRSQAANSTALNLSFQGTAIKSEGNLLIKDQVKYLSLAFVTKQLPITAVWQPDTGAIRLETGLNIYELHEDQQNYMAVNVEKKLTAAPFEQAGQLWFPVTFLSMEFGIVVRNDDDQSLDLEWAENYLIAVEPSTYQGRPAVALVGTKPLQINSFVLQEPERLVLDLNGFKAYPGLDTAGLSHPLLQKVRVGQFQADTLRLVCDLKQRCGYQIIADPQNANRILVVFNYLVQTINFFKRDGAERVHIKTDYPAVYKVIQLSKPLRAVIDLTGATLADPRPVVAGKGKCIKGVRISQYDPQTVRIVLDLANTNWPYQVRSLRKDPTILEVRTVQKVQSIECYEATPELTKLVITGSGELAETVRKLKHPSRLQIDLDFFQFTAQLSKPGIHKLSRIKGLRLQALNPTTVRIEAELNYLAGYEVKLSEDYQQLEVSLLKSPLVGTTLVLDPGHGGEDGGATGIQGTREKDINFDVALRLKELLDEAGTNVILTRNGDYYISLYERSFIANQLPGDIFVSIHANFHPNPNVHGIEVYSYKGMADSALLAKLVEAKLVKQTQMNSLGIKNNDFVVIREPLMPSILVELGYLSYGPEETLLQTTAFKDQAALGIYRGIIAYYHTKQSAAQQE
jgi:N-acetylmuramoyl-L-alanine amidase